MRINEPNSNKDSNALVDSILARIQTEQVTPKPRWYFIFSECVMWLLWLITALIGAAAVAVMLYVWMHMHYSFYEATHESGWSFLLEALPLLWFLVFVTMAVVGYQNLRHTRKGYRHPVWFILLTSLVASLVGGAFLYALGAGPAIDRALERSMPMFISLQSYEKQLWMHPSEGRLVGRLSSYSSGDVDAVFVDLQQNVWLIDTSDLMSMDHQVLHSGAKVKLIGISSTSTPAHFHACGVFPWMYEKEVRLPDMQKERQEFIRRMYDHKERVEERLLELENLVFSTSTQMDMGPCAQHAVVRRIEEKMMR